MYTCSMETRLQGANKRTSAWVGSPQPWFAIMPTPKPYHIEAVNVGQLFGVGLGLPFRKDGIIEPKPINLSIILYLNKLHHSCNLEPLLTHVNIMDEN